MDEYHRWQTVVDYSCPLSRPMHQAMYKIVAFQLSLLCEPASLAQSFYSAEDSVC